MTGDITVRFQDKVNLDTWLKRNGIQKYDKGGKSLVLVSQEVQKANSARR